MSRFGGARVRDGAVACGAALLVAGCGVPVEPLMPTPMVYAEGELAPFRHVPREERRPIIDILYATNRGRDDDWRVIEYGNTPTDRVSLGGAAVRIGGPEMTWDALVAASTTADRSSPVRIEMAGILERGGFAVSEPIAEPTLESREFVEAINRRVAASGCDDVFIYVHGAKVNFYNACAYTGQLAHFMGRDMVGVAFSWPTSQDLVSYAMGRDVRVAYESSEALASLIEFVSAYTEARRIHVLTWSAGSRVVSSALAELRERYPAASIEELRERFRLGTVIFAAGEVPLDEFMDRVEVVHGLCDRVVVTLTDNDGTLTQARRFMGGGRRLGQHGERLSDEERARIDGMERLEVIDVSFGKEARGFNIEGHRYWFEHPWCSTDTLLALRTGLPAADRGLVRLEGWQRIWVLPPDYPERVREVVARLGIDDWTEKRGGP